MQTCACAHTCMQTCHSQTSTHLQVRAHARSEPTSHATASSICFGDECEAQTLGSTGRGLSVCALDPLPTAPQSQNPRRGLLPSVQFRYWPIRQRRAAKHSASGKVLRQQLGEFCSEFRTRKLVAVHGPWLVLLLAARGAQDIQRSPVQSTESRGCHMS